MKLGSCIILLLVAQLSSAQLIVKSIHKKSTHSKAQPQADVTEAALPFWDDFSITNEEPDSVRVWGSDSSLQWDPNRSRGVFINSTLAINPPTYKVATFDGLDGEGNFYVSDNNAKGLTDRLASYPIDLSSFDSNDDVHISFFWQAGGNVEVPEEGDSLILKLFNEDMDSLTVWKVEGGEQIEETEFTEVMLKIPTAFLTANFRFQFEAYGDQDGPFDAWHLDWIYLDQGRNFSELTTGYLDRAFSGQFTSIFTPFQTVPVHQLRVDPQKFIGEQSIFVSNLDKIDLQPIDYRHTIRELVSNQELFLNSSELVTPILRKDTIQIVPLDSISLSAFPAGDSLILQSEIMIQDAKDSLLSGSIDLKVNDTIRQNYLLQDHYAFDDGTAEFAAGTNIKNAQVAVQFWVDQPDTLTHIDFQFPNISPILQSSAVLSLRVMRELADTGLLRSQQVTVRDTVRNAFIRYELDRPVVVSDTFFIGYQQFINDYIGIGFDRSNPEASQYIFENKDGDWIQNISLKGALMIRPVFKSGTLLTLGAQPEKEVTIYPNPTKGHFKIADSYDKIQLLDLSGKILLEEKNQSSHDISKFEHGLYLLRIFQESVQTTKKIILR